MSTADTARRLITKFGRIDGALSRQALTDNIQVDRPWASEESDPLVSPVVAQGLSVVVLDALTVLKPEQLMLEQTAVAYMAAGNEPKALDTLTTRGKTYSILRVEELAPGADTVLYTLHLKGR